MAVLGATGAVGTALCRMLHEDGERIIAVARSRDRLQALARAVPGVEIRALEKTYRKHLADAIAGAERVASCIEAEYADAVMDAVPPGLRRLVLIGSARVFTRFPDPRAEQIRAMLDRVRASPPAPTAVLLPTMLYGGVRGDTVQRVIDLVRRFPVVPLPNGGRSLVQPLHAIDAARAVRAALMRDEAVGEPIALAGGNALSYADFVRVCARAAGCRVIVLPVPVSLALAGACLAGRVPGLPALAREEILRTTEDKAHDVAPMRERLGVNPMTFEEGMALAYPRAPTRAADPP